MKDSKGAGFAIGLVAVFLLPVLVVVMVLAGPGGSSPAVAACLPGVSVDTGKLPSVSVAGYQGEQLKNAALIMNAGKKLGLSTQGQVIGVMVAMGESSLRVLDRGDAAGPDSRGLFQQRANGAWGSYTDRMNPTISATNFFKALLKVPGWESMTPTLAAHAVQRNLDPNHYARFAAPAASVVSALGGVSVQQSSCGAGLPGDLGKGDDYRFKSGLYNGNNPVTGFAFKNCTDFAWWRMMQQLGITDQSKMDARKLGPGHAITWGPTWQRAGWTVSMTPKVGAIIWYGPGNPGGDSTYGHVAVVKAVNKDGSVLEEGYNMGPDHLGAYYTRTIKAASVSGYLYIPSMTQMKTYL